MKKKSGLVFTLFISFSLIYFLQMDWVIDRKTVRKETILVKNQPEVNPNGPLFREPQTRAPSHHPEPPPPLLRYLEQDDTESFLRELKKHNPKSLDRQEQYSSSRILSLSIAKRKHVETRALIKKGCKLEEADALLEVLKDQDTSYLKFLAALKVNANIPSSEHPNKPIHYAVRLGDPEMVRLILQMNAKVRDRDRAGLTAFEYAELKENLLNFHNPLDQYEQIKKFLKGDF